MVVDVLTIILLGEFIFSEIWLKMYSILFICTFCGNAEKKARYKNFILILSSIEMILPHIYLQVPEHQLLPEHRRTLWCVYVAFIYAQQRVKINLEDSEFRGKKISIQINSFFEGSIPVSQLHQ